MSVEIRNMTEREFAAFYQWSVEQHARELMEELQIPFERAIKKASEEVAQMLPEGMATACNDLLTIVAEGENAGFLWALYEEFQGKQQCFLCDFALWEAWRRKGYGAAALQLIERRAAQAGCREMVLFVRDENAAARALYGKCGYQVPRQEGHGKFMVKQLL